VKIQKFLNFVKNNSFKIWILDVIHVVVSSNTVNHTPLVMSLFKKFVITKFEANISLFVFNSPSFAKLFRAKAGGRAYPDDGQNYKYNYADNNSLGTAAYVFGGQDINRACTKKQKASKNKITQGPVNFFVATTGIVQFDM